jgi:hypothetical protein
MSYLRGPMTRDQIGELMAAERDLATSAAAAAPAGGGPATSGAPSGSAAPAAQLADDETTVMPEIADGVPVRWIDVAAPWLAEAGGDEAGKRLEAAVVARVQLRYDETKADLVHDEEYECVIAPITETADISRAIAVDYDERDLRTDPPEGAVYAMSDAKLSTKSLFSGIERDLKDHVARNLTIEIPANPELKLYGRPGETAEQFELRCLRAADEAADAELAKLRDKYEAKVTKLRDQIEAAEDRVDVLEEQSSSKRNSELLSTAGSILGGLLGGGRSRGGLLGKLGTAANRRGTTKATKQRLDAAENKVGRLQESLEGLELDLEEEVTEIDARWMALGKQVDTLQIGLEKTDVKVAELVLAWLPVA